ncbi:hypothetical protein DPEC_G00104820 [Dallia pectoralis]|uniref:Uncharacterized protein n=1 Tax=Dallia pectoralis TaxID=75939 RepID=A0ACC2GYQ1_DALPE|nr:hypothetical protein DPEC_G00104820 [Dallia pectoralis]
MTRIYNEAILKRFKRKLDLIFEYNGLVNEGATCYLNSVLQVLFMTKRFREAVESHSGKNLRDIDFQLKILFNTLKTDEANIKDILSTLGIVYVHEQRDAAEYLEKLLSMVNPDWSKMFKGLFRHTTSCSKGHEAGDGTGAFWTLPLSIDHPSDKCCSVRLGFEEFFKSSTVSKMYCDQCEEKTDATIACEVVEPPEILTLFLKRFEFDYSKMSYVKKDCCVDVPHTLQIKNCDYELYAVVDHVGSLRGGHYTATIKSYEDHYWYVFDDAYVRKANQHSIKHMDNERSHSPYLLMYRKACAPDQPEEEIKKTVEFKCVHQDQKRIEDKLRIIMECKSKKEEQKQMETKSWEDNNRSRMNDNPLGNPCPMTITGMGRKEIQKNRSGIEKCRQGNEDYRRREIKRLAESSRPLRLAESSRPLHLAESSRPLRLAESSRPLHLAESSRPLHLAESSRPLHLAESSRPLHLAESSRPLHLAVPETSHHLATSSRSQHLAESSRPLHLAESSRPLHLAESSRPLHLAESSRPLHLAESSRPLHLAESSRPLHLAESSRPLHLAESSRPLHLAESSRPLHLAESSRPLHLAESSRPLHLAESSRSLHLAESSRSLHLAESSRSLHLAESSRPLHLAETKSKYYFQ